MNREIIRAAVEEGRIGLRFELGPNEIKAMLTDETQSVLAEGTAEWGKPLTEQAVYDLGDVWMTMSRSYGALRDAVEQDCGVRIKKAQSLAIRALQYGCMMLYERELCLAPAATGMVPAEKGAQELERLLGKQIAPNLGAAYLQQEIMDGAPYIPDVKSVTNLAGYVHRGLGGRKVMGPGAAAGLFPVDAAAGDYDQEALGAWTQALEGRGLPWKPTEVLPAVKRPDERGGFLSLKGTLILDVTGSLEAGIPMLPPEAL